MNLREAFGRIRGTALTFAPAGEAGIKDASAALTGEGHPALPADYAEFLRLSDGIVWNGMTLYGTPMIVREYHGQEFPDILEANRRLKRRRPDLGDRLLLGGMDDDIHVYDPADGRYYVLDRMGMDEMEDYDDFAGLFAAIVARFA